MFVIQRKLPPAHITFMGFSVEYWWLVTNWIPNQSKIESDFSDYFLICPSTKPKSNYSSSNFFIAVFRKLCHQNLILSSTFFIPYLSFWQHFLCSSYYHHSLISRVYCSNTANPQVSDDSSMNHVSFFILIQPHSLISLFFLLSLIHFQVNISLH